MAQRVLSRFFFNLLSIIVLDSRKLDTSLSRDGIFMSCRSGGGARLNVASKGEILVE